MEKPEMVKRQESIDEAVLVERDRAMRADVVYAFGLHFAASLDRGWNTDTTEYAAEFLMKKIRQRIELERNLARKEAKSQFLRDRYDNSPVDGNAPDSNCYTENDGSCTSDKPCMHSDTEAILYKQGWEAGYAACDADFHKSAKNDAIAPGQALDLFTCGEPYSDMAPIAVVTLMPSYLMDVVINGICVGKIKRNGRDQSAKWIYSSEHIRHTQTVPGSLRDVVMAAISENYESSNSPHIEVVLKAPDNWYDKDSEKMED